MLLFSNPLVCKLESIAQSGNCHFVDSTHGKPDPGVPDMPMGLTAEWMNTCILPSPLFLWCFSWNQKPMFLRGVLQKYFLCAAPVHTEPKGLTGEQLWKQPKVTGGKSKDFLSLLPHPGDCKHWLLATRCVPQHRTSLCSGFMVLLFHESQQALCCHPTLMSGNPRRGVLPCRRWRCTLLMGASYASKVLLVVCLSQV